MFQPLKYLDPPLCDCCKAYYTKYKYQSIGLCTHCNEHHRDLGRVLLTYIDKQPSLVWEFYECGIFDLFYNRVLLVLEWCHVTVVAYILGQKNSLHLSTLHAVIVLTSAKNVHSVIALATLMEILLLCLLKKNFHKLNNYILSFLIMRDTLYF